MTISFDLKKNHGFGSIQEGPALINPTVKKIFFISIHLKISQVFLLTPFLVFSPLNVGLVFQRQGSEKAPRFHCRQTRQGKQIIQSDTYILHTVRLRSLVHFYIWTPYIK